MDMRSGDRSKYFRNLFRTAIFGILVGIVSLGAILTKMQYEALTAPKPSVPSEDPGDYDLAFDDISLKAQDGIRLTGWFLPAENSNGAAIVLAHGRGGNRAVHLPTAALLTHHGYSVLLLDLRAHGQSEGDWVSYGYFEALDILAAVDYLVIHEGFIPERIGLMGHSMGSAAVLRAASLRESRHVLVIVSAYSSLQGGVEDAFDDIAALPSWPFAPIIVGMAERRVGAGMDALDLEQDLAKMEERPILLIHGEVDGLLPLDHYYTLLLAAGEMAEGWVVPGMGHEDPARFDPRGFEQRLFAFLDRHLAVPSSQDNP